MRADAFNKRRQIELACIKQFKGMQISSGNFKTGLSVNFPLITCQPTKVCISLCYACKGRLAMRSPIEYSCKTYMAFKKYSTATLKLYILKAFIDIPFIRWNGTGDLFEESIAVINSITEKPQIVFSRIPSLLNKVNRNVLRVFSADLSNYKSIEQLDKDIVISWLFNMKPIPDEVKPKIQIIFANSPKEYNYILDMRRAFCLGDVGGKKELACAKCLKSKVGCFKYYEALQ